MPLSQRKTLPDCSPPPHPPSQTLLEILLFFFFVHLLSKKPHLFISSLSTQIFCDLRIWWLTDLDMCEFAMRDSSLGYFGVGKVHGQQRGAALNEGF